MSFIDLWADEMWILTIEGWKESKGIAAERKRADRIGMPVVEYNLCDNDEEPGDPYP